MPLRLNKIEFSEDQINEVCEQLIANAPHKVLCFYGTMGVGKTTIIKALVKQLGANGPASSPSFGIVNEYQDANGDLLGYHFDFYRLQDETEALDFGLEEYFEKDAWVFIEWPEKVTSFLPENRTDIYIEAKSESARKLKFN